jgi:hypothetical protein
MSEMSKNLHPFKAFFKFWKEPGIHELLMHHVDDIVMVETPLVRLEFRSFPSSRSL